MEKLNFSITLRVEGKEEMESVLSFKGTDMATVILYEQAILRMIGDLLTQQKAGKI